jgi:hypothetical protein
MGKRLEPWAELLGRGGGGKPLVPKTGPLDESFGTDMAKHSL